MNIATEADMMLKKEENSQNRYERERHISIKKHASHNSQV